ncbi:hypothetical protein BJY52DRAFT_1303315 [Lactarius psammicola]|nr:hypothetical protein BJY52DRAFT_1303315 [Lactarius psammicola]
MRRGRTERAATPGVKLTGFRLLKIVILAFGITEAALAYCGQSSALTTPVWVAGASSAIILYWVGQFGTRKAMKSHLVSTASIHRIID